MDITYLFNTTSALLGISVLAPIVIAPMYRVATKGDNQTPEDPRAKTWVLGACVAYLGSTLALFIQLLIFASGVESNYAEVYFHPALVVGAFLFSTGVLLSFPVVWAYLGLPSLRETAVDYGIGFGIGSAYALRLPFVVQVWQASGSEGWGEHVPLLAVGFIFYLLSFLRYTKLDRSMIRVFPGIATFFIICSFVVLPRFFI